MRSTLRLTLIMIVLLFVSVRDIQAEQLSSLALQEHKTLPQAKAKDTPTVSVWPTASAINQGQALAASTLNGGTASVPGAFSFTDSSIVPDAGTYAASVTFTPTDTTNFATVSGTVNIPVNASNATTPSVSVWPTASAITYGQKLTYSRLIGGVASVEGTFTFTDPAIVPKPGTYEAAVTFIPSDAAHYKTVPGSVNVTVNKVSGNYELTEYLKIPILVLASLGIVRLAEIGRLDGPCFIATAAWGTPLAPEIDRLREFRDNKLLAGAVGTASVDVYYQVSPAIADLVAVSPMFAMMVRIVLIPVIILVSLPTPILTGLLLLVGTILVRRIVRRYMSV